MTRLLGSPDELDLSRHALIEASAGTGKTHAMAGVVVRLVTAAEIPLERILLVTFTEKATAELRERIRGALARTRGEPEPAGGRARRALAGFDEAQVFTIHGFCHRLLREEPLLMGESLAAELVDETPLRRRLLRELQRAEWPTRFGAALPAALGLARFAELGDGGSGWEARTLALAARWRPAWDERLRPEPLPDLPERLGALAAEAARARAEVAGRAGLAPGRDPRESPWWAAYDRIPLRADWRRPRRQKVLRPLLLWAAGPAEGLSGFARLRPRLERIDSFVSHRFSALLPGEKERAAAPGLCPGLLETIERMNELDRRIPPGLEHQLALDAAVRLREALAGHKAARGLLAYDDLLTRVDAALDPARSPRAGEALTRLRGRWSFALVDEFHDTDSLQWRIFRRLFTGPGAGRLVLIGDPKQAIYGFRGADPAAYREAAAALAGPVHGGVKYLLTRNWRSRVRLVRAVNAVAGEGGLLTGADQDFRPADTVEKRPWVYEDATGRRPLTVVAPPAEAAGARARALTLAAMAAEARRLLGLGGGGRPLLALGEDRAPLLAGQVAFLVRSHREAELAEQALARAGVPHARYKRPGLWASDEALHLAFLLEALARPEEPAARRRALLTRFFGTGPAGRPLAWTEAAGLAAPSGENPLGQILGRWRELAAGRRWGALFRSLLEDTGLCRREAAAPDGERRLAAWERLRRQLEEEALARSLDLPDLVERIRELRREAPPEELDLHGPESDEPRVQVLTIHAAKGLEFPVVFLAGGFTQGQPRPPRRYHDEAGRIVHDLAPDGEAGRRADVEEEAESRRLLYVALTRAMVKLYAPLLPEMAVKHNRRSLLALLRPALEGVLPGLAAAGLAGRADLADGRLAPPAGEAAPDQDGPGRDGSPPVPAPAPPPGPEPPTPLDLAGRVVAVRSFSSLAGLAAEPAGEGADRADDDPGEAGAPAEPDPAPGPLPAGRELGDLVHRILARADFALAGAAGAPAELLAGAACAPLAALAGAELAAAFPALGAGAREEALAWLLDRLWAALHTPLPGPGIPLWRIPEEKRWAEEPFLLRLAGPRRGAPGTMAPGPYLTGAIDLVFQAGEEVWLLDWKTNRLPGGYGPEALAAAMAAHSYDLQAEIYALALAGWLRGLAARPRLGGVLFVFLRGLTGTAGSPGVWRAPAPAPGWEEEARDRLRRLLPREEP